MSALLGQTPNYTVSLTQTDTHVFWRGQWHRFAGAEDPPPAGDPPPPPTPPPAQDPPAGTGGQTPPAKPFDDAYVRDLRKENAAYRKAAEEAQARLKEIDDAGKSELEKAQAKTAELQAQLTAAQTAHRSALISAAVMAEATAQGANPEAIKRGTIARLVDTSAIELDDSGEVKGADKAVKALLEAEPYLKAGTAGTTAVPGTPRQNGQNVTRESRVDDALKEMEVRYRLP